MSNQNEVANVNPETGEIIEGATIVEEKENYVVLKDNNGKFKRKAKFNDYSSIQAETREDKIWLMNLIENDEDTGQGLKDHANKEIVVQDIITRKYDKVNEDTGEIEYGVLTYLITPEREAFVTSSKSVYFTISKIMDMFGKPDSDDWENIKVKVYKKKETNGEAVKIKLIG